MSTKNIQNFMITHATLGEHLETKLINRVNIASDRQLDNKEQKQWIWKTRLFLLKKQLNSK